MPELVLVADMCDSNFLELQTHNIMLMTRGCLQLHELASADNS